MKLLHIGDVVGAAGSRFLQEHLPAIKRTHKISMWKHLAEKEKALRDLSQSAL